MISHTIVIDINTNTVTGPPVEIPQGDKNSHQILIKLVRGRKFYSIDEGLTPKVTFYDSFDEEILTSTSVSIVNHHRGYINYPVGLRLVEDFGRYVGRLDLYDESSERSVSAKFIVNVVKSAVDDGPVESYAEVKFVTVLPADNYAAGNVLYVYTNPETGSTTFLRWEGEWVEIGGSVSGIRGQGAVDVQLSDKRVATVKINLDNSGDVEFSETKLGLRAGLSPEISRALRWGKISEE